MLEKILATVFVFGLLVFVHELGHFITAKLTGMRVDEFAIGFGPRLVSFRYGETVYSIRIVPLGGFNDIAGMNADDNDAGERGYCRKPILSRMIVILAGSAMNFILPVVLFFGIFFFAGVQTPNPAPILGTVLADGPAAEAGLMANDRILAIDGKPIETWQELVDGIRTNHGTVPMTVQVDRAGKELTVSVTPRYDASHDRGYIGIVNAYESTYPGFFQSVSMAFERTAMIIAMMLDALYRLVQERGDIFMQEAAQCGLPALPYKGGFFLAIPAADPQAVCNLLHEDLIFAVPLKMGVRIAACSVPKAKMYGIAEKVNRAMDKMP